MSPMMVRLSAVSPLVHPIRFLRLAMNALLCRRRLAPKATLEQKDSEGEVAKALWRGAVVQMKAVNTASAWPMWRRREMRAEAEARLDKYFAQLERMIAAERLARFYSATTSGPLDHGTTT